MERIRSSLVSSPAQPLPLHQEYHFRGYFRTSWGRQLITTRQKNARVHTHIPVVPALVCDVLTVDGEPKAWAMVKFLKIVARREGGGGVPACRPPGDLEASKPRTISPTHAYEICWRFCRKTMRYASRCLFERI